VEEITQRDCIFNHLWCCYSSTSFDIFPCFEYQVFIHTNCKYNFPCHCSFTYILLPPTCARTEENFETVNNLVMSQNSRQNKVSGRLWNLWRRSLAFSSLQALHGLLLPGRLLTVSVSRNFLNSLLTPRFVQLFSGNSSVDLLAVYPLKYKLFLKILSLSLNTMLTVDKPAVTCAVTNFQCHRLIAKVIK